MCVLMRSGYGGGPSGLVPIPDGKLPVDLPSVVHLFDAPAPLFKVGSMLRALARRRCLYHAPGSLHASHLPGEFTERGPGPSAEGRRGNATVAALLAAVQADLGAPWWSVLLGSTLALRLALLPLALQQTRASIALGPNLQRARQRAGGPPASPSLAVVRDVLKYSRQSGAPHPAWVLAPLVVQVPTFVLCMATVSGLAHDPALAGALAAGGALWFPDLTLPAVRLTLHATHYACPMGLPGFALPIAACATAFASLELRASRADLPWERSLRLALQWLTLPFFLAALQMPHAVFCYWIPNSLISMGQVRRSLASVAHSRDAIVPRGPSLCVV